MNASKRVNYIVINDIFPTMEYMHSGTFENEYLPFGECEKMIRDSDLLFRQNGDKK